MLRFFLLLFIVVSLTSCFTGKAIEYQKIKNLRPDKIGKESVLVMDVEFLNPNNWGCTLESMTSEIRFDNRLLGSCELTAPVQLKPTSTQIWPCKLNVSVVQVIKSLPSGLGIIFGDQKIKANIKGTLHVRKWIFRKEYPFDIDQLVDGQWLKNLY
jgi:LEA14-like dessication related protein